MPKIVINEYDQTSPGTAAQNPEVVYIPGLVDTECRNFYELKKVNGEDEEFYRGCLEPFVPTLFTSVSDFVYAVGEHGYVFEKDQLYSDITTGQFDDDDIPYHNTMFKAGDTDPSYVMAKELLAAGLSVVYERINAEPSKVKVTSQPADWGQDGINYYEKITDAYKAIEKPIRYFNVVANPVAGKTYYEANINGSNITYTEVTPDKIKSDVIYYEKTAAISESGEAKETFSKFTKFEREEIVSIADTYIHRVVFSGEDTHLTQINGNEHCVLYTPEENEYAVAYRCYNLGYVTNPDPSSYISDWKFTVQNNSTTGLKTLKTSSTATKNFYTPSIGFNFQSYKKEDDTFFTAEELNTIGVYTLTVQGTFEPKIFSDNAEVEAAISTTPLFKEGINSLVPFAIKNTITEELNTMTWHNLADLGVRKAYKYNTTKGIYVEDATAEFWLNKEGEGYTPQKSSVYSENSSVANIYFFDITTMFFSPGNIPLTSGSELLPYIKACYVDFDEIVKDNFYFSSVAKVTREYSEPPAGSFIKTSNNLFIPATTGSSSDDIYIANFYPVFDINTYTIPVDYLSSYNNYYIKTEAFISAGSEFSDNIYTDDNHCNINSIYSNLKTVYTADRDNGLDDKGKIDIKYLTSGGYPIYGYNGGDIAKTMIALAEARGDCFAFIDPTDNDARPSNLNDTRSIYARVKADSSIATTFGTMLIPHMPYVRNTVDYIRDADDQRVIKASGSIRLPATYAYLEALADSITVNPSWLAIAGAARGVVPNLESGSTSPITNKNADAMQPRDAIAINSITNIKPYGDVIWGNRTLSNNKDGNLTALSFLNIRNLVCNVKKLCYTTAKALTFEQNNEVLWLNFKGRIAPTLDQMLTGAGISKYKIERNMEHEKALEKATVCVRITLYPVYAVEDFYIDIVLSDDEVVTAE